MTDKRGAGLPSGSAVRAEWALEVENLSKTFGIAKALDRVDIRIRSGNVLGLLGANGSGKSTLIKILAGYHHPDPGGKVMISGEALQFGSGRGSQLAGCRFVHQDLALIDDLSVADNLLLGCGYPTRAGLIVRREAASLVQTALERVGLAIDPSSLIGALSLGSRTLVAIARALSGSGDATRLLVLDEPTATLPEPEVEQLLETVRRIASTGVGVLYVTHRMEEVFELTKTVAVLRDGRVTLTAPTEQLDRKGIAKAMLGSELVEAKAGPLGSTQRRVCLRVDALTTAPLREVSFDVAVGEIVGIAGITGSGRDALLPAIFGVRTRTSGLVWIDGQEVPDRRPRLSIERGIALVPADRTREASIMALTGTENLTLANLRPIWRWPTLRKGVESTEAEDWTRRLGIHPPSGMARAMSTFSGGNQQKIILARWLRRRPKVLLLDEPTQGVDIGAKVEIHHHIRAAAADGAAVVVSSVDVDELVALAQRVIVLRSGRVAAEFEGEALTEPAVSHEALLAEAIGV
jgi:ribose transport system ATP-binding protein